MLDEGASIDAAGWFDTTTGKTSGWHCHIEEKRTQRNTHSHSARLKQQR